MREIRFRGKRVDTQEFVYGCLLYDQEQNKAFIAEYFEDKSAYFREVIPESVGQYTGLKDKNGVEIYEGDVVRIPKSICPDNCYQIVWFNNNACFGSVGNIAGESKAFNIDYGVCNKSVEVIGNIHDNPSLLEVQP